MQACPVNDYSLFFGCFFPGLLYFRTLGILGFLELLQPLTDALHQLRDLTASKEKYNDNQNQNNFESTKFSHLLKYLVSCKCIKLIEGQQQIFKIFTS